MRFFLFSISLPRRLLTFLLAFRRCAFYLYIFAPPTRTGTHLPAHLYLLAVGWRSWNLYGANVNQELIEGIMDGMQSRKRMVDGKPTSLCDLGYCDVGLDDNWQQCSKYGKDAFTYHDEAGFPVVNKARFPDFIKMTDHAHSLNLTSGWYLNNCICSDHCGDRKDQSETNPKCYNGDVAALIEFGFDSVKLDGCGAQRDLNVWADLMNKSGKAIMIENCHWGGTVPNATWCPWNFFRTSGDVRASYGSIVGNLQTTVQWATKGLSRPGCWAYPDMLEVGCAHGPGGAGDPGLSAEETRAHFGAWSIVSSPLTLSHDVNNDTITDKIWPVIANPEAIAVNQAWAGHSGSPFKSAEALVAMKDKAEATPAWQYFYKPMEAGGKKDAVLLMNHADKAADLTLTFSDIPTATCTKCSVRDVWARKDLGTFDGTFTAKGLASHDAAFLVITPASDASEM